MNNTTTDNQVKPTKTISFAFGEGVDMKNIEICNTLKPKKTKEGFEVLKRIFNTKKEAMVYCNEIVRKKLREPGEYTEFDWYNETICDVYHKYGDNKQYLFSYELLSNKKLEVFLEW